MVCGSEKGNDVPTLCYLGVLPLMNLVHVYKQIEKNLPKSSKSAKKCFLIYMQCGRTSSSALFKRN